MLGGCGGFFVGGCFACVGAHVARLFAFAFSRGRFGKRACFRQACFQRGACVRGNAVVQVGGNGLQNVKRCRFDDFGCEFVQQLGGGFQRRRHNFGREVGGGFQFHTLHLRGAHPQVGQVHRGGRRVFGGLCGGFAALCIAAEDFFGQFLPPAHFHARHAVERFQLRHDFALDERFEFTAREFRRRGAGGDDRQVGEVEVEQLRRFYAFGQLHLFDGVRQLFAQGFLVKPEFVAHDDDGDAARRGGFDIDHAVNGADGFFQRNGDRITDFFG